VIEPLPTYVLLLGRGGSGGDAGCVPCNSTLHVSELHGARWDPSGEDRLSPNPNSSRLILPEVDHQTDHHTEGLQRSYPDALA
jgi:hypothetical protein